MYADKIVKKIPGEAPKSRKDSQGYIEDLGKKPLIELQEILERQNKLLANKGFISKLPDKGEKIRTFRDKVLKEINLKNEVEQAAKLLSKLNIASQGKAAMTQLEWTGKYSEKDECEVVELDSDDETDPLKILAQPTGTGVHKKKIIHLPPEESLIKKEDLEDAESTSGTSDVTDILNEEHVKYIIEKVEKTKDKQREPFKPYKTTKSNVHDPEKEKLRKKNKYWENTAATPPLIVHGAVKLLSINESLILEKEKADKLQELQIQQAAQRLAERIGKNEIGPLPSKVGTYRDRKKSETSDSEHEDNQVYDDDDDDKGGTVLYSVES